MFLLCLLQIMQSPTFLNTQQADIFMTNCTFQQCSDAIKNRLGKKWMDYKLNIVYEEKLSRADHLPRDDSIVESGFGELPKRPDDPTTPFWIGLNYVKLFDRKAHLRLEASFCRRRKTFECVFFEIFDRFEFSEYALTVFGRSNKSTLRLLHDDSGKEKDDVVRRTVNNRFRVMRLKRSHYLPTVDAKYHTAIQKVPTPFDIQQMTVFYHGEWSSWTPSGKSCDCNPITLRRKDVINEKRRCDRPAPLEDSFGCAGGVSQRQIPCVLKCGHRGFGKPAPLTAVCKIVIMSIFTMNGLLEKGKFKNLTSRKHCVKFRRLRSKFRTPCLRFRRLGRLVYLNAEDNEHTDFMVGNQISGVPKKPFSHKVQMQFRDSNMTKMFNRFICDLKYDGGDSELLNCTTIKNSLFENDPDITFRLRCLRYYPIDGGWTSWQRASDCSVSCGNGSLTKTRTCTNPQPALGGKNCFGTKSEKDSCHRPCHSVDGGWSSWQKHGGCGHLCGPGSQRWRRSCTKPAPVYKGRNCSGDNEKTTDCVGDVCEFAESSKMLWAVGIAGVLLILSFVMWWCRDSFCQCLKQNKNHDPESKHNSDSDSDCEYISDDTGSFGMPYGRAIMAGMDSDSDTFGEFESTNYAPVSFHG